MSYPTSLSHFNIKELNDMQKAMWAAIHQAQDVILNSPTGSGKTLAFLLPVVQLLPQVVKNTSVLIIVPSRELAIQIEGVFKQLRSSYKINACYGGHAVRTEEKNLLHPPAVLVGTPGRIAHHLRKNTVVTDNIHTLILDEFDKTLELGFQDEMEYILSKCRKASKRILTSATTMQEIPPFVRLNNAITLNYSTLNEGFRSALILKSVKVNGDDKTEALIALLCKYSPGTTLVFCNHRDAVARISEQLTIYKIIHGVYHGGLDQAEREKVLIKLRNGSIQILITTDLASRGLDIAETSLVVHYQLPATEDVMIHRNGRTARMSADGTAIFLLDQNDLLPEFVKPIPIEEDLPEKIVLPRPPDWQTLYIAAGKKEKINKVDLVGMLIQKGGLKKEELGRIDVLDHVSYVAIRSNKILQTLRLIKDEKIKNKKIRMEIAS